VFVVEAAVASDLATNEVGLRERFVGTTQLHLRHNKTIVVAVEFVYLKGVAPIGTLHQIAVLVDKSTSAELQQVLGFVDGDFLFKLVA
jgi:hypothetical protein